MQQTFFGAPAASNGFRDSSFAKNKSLALHRWVPWVAGFSADFVEDCFDKYLPGASDGWVLDPFAGVGTTLVEAYLRGLNAIGFEINPYAALASTLKLKAHTISTHELGREIASFERLRLVAQNMPGWQATRFPSHMILYPENREYEHGLRIWPIHQGG